MNTAMAHLSPTALEEAAKALYREFENRPLYAQTQMNGVIANECATAAITAYLAQREKEGWVMVPVEPTAAMIEAGCDNNPTEWNEETDLGFADDVANDVYRAMLAAAQNGGDLPAPPMGK